MEKDWLSVASNVLFFIIFYMLFSGGLQALGLAFTGEKFLKSDYEFTTFQHLFTSLLDLVASTLLTWYFLKGAGISFKDLGFKVSFNQFLQAFVLGGIFIALAFVTFGILDLIETRPLPFNGSEFLMVTLFLFVAALCEEIIFRGFFMKMMQKYVGVFWAVILSSLIFSLFHVFNPNVTIVGLLEIFLAGIAIAYAYFKTGNIWFVTVMHFAWNYVQTLLGFNVSGQDFYSFVEFSKIEESAVTGGKFGFEGSVFSSVAEVITIYILSFYNSKRLGIFL